MPSIFGMNSGAVERHSSAVPPAAPSRSLARRRRSASFRSCGFQQRSGHRDQEPVSTPDFTRVSALEV